jgi:hypothetical protein
VMSDAKSGGTRLLNGSWTHRLGEIQTGQVDMFPHTSEYLDRFDSFAAYNTCLL